MAKQTRCKYCDKSKAQINEEKIALFCDDSPDGLHNMQTRIVP